MLDKIFNRILVINMPDDKKRLEQINNELLKCGTIYYDVIPGVKMDLPDQAARQIIGNRRAHMRALFWACNKNYQDVLVLEDDALIDWPLFTKEIQEELFEFKQRNDWALLYLGGHHRGASTINPYGNYKHIRRTTGTLATHAIAYNMEYFLNFINAFNRPDTDLTPVDYCLCGYPAKPMIKTLQKELPCFTIYPRFIYQRDNVQKITGRHVPVDYWKEP